MGRTSWAMRGALVTGAVAVALVGSLWLSFWPWWVWCALACVGWASRAWVPVRADVPCLLDPRVYDATVHHHEQLDDHDGLCYDAVFVELHPEGRSGPVLARLGDMIAPEDLERFAVGSRWRVRRFEPSKLWVAMLAADHDDVLRCGVDLSGVRWGAELRYWREGRPGSPYSRTGPE